MRIATAALAAIIGTATTATAQSEFSFSVGVMQRSFTEGTNILEDNLGNLFLTSDDIDASGLSYEAQVIGDGMWGRALVYSDSFDQTVIGGATGVFFDTSPAGFGLNGGGVEANFTRETSLMRFDFMTEVAQVSGVDIYVGGSLARISDDLGAVMSNSTLSGTFAWEGSTDMVGAVIGGRYDYAPSAGPSGLSFSTFGTLGIYHASHSMDYSLDAVPHNASADDSGVTGAAEIGISLNYAFSENSEFSLTYQAAFYGDAIDSIEAINATNVASPISTEATTSSVLYQGLSASYVFRF